PAVNVTQNGRLADSRCRLSSASVQLIRNRHSCVPMGAFHLGGVIASAHRRISLARFLSVLSFYDKRA
ncbi:MAG: hypothetical protein P8077_01815, partial [Gammaproteobacteria bacterium]